MTEFIGFPKMARYSRDVIVTEKIDGTNAQIYIGEDGEFLTGSRTRWITPEDDNFGFSRWAHEHKDELLTLGPGRHYGEWWGQGIQRNYGLRERRFSLFNVMRWCEYGKTPQQIQTNDPRVTKIQDMLPQCVNKVPALWIGTFDFLVVNDILLTLSANGSVAVPGWMKPEGIVVYHIAGNARFKKTIDNDNHKSA